MVKYRDYSNNKEFAVQFGLNCGLDRVCVVYPEEGFTDDDFNSTICFLAKKYSLPIFRSIDGMLYMSTLGEMKRISSDYVIVFIISVLKNTKCIHRYTKKSFDSMEWADTYTNIEEHKPEHTNCDDPYLSKLRNIGKRDKFTLDKVLDIHLKIPCIDIKNFDFNTYLGPFVIVNNYKDKDGKVGQKLFIYNNFTDITKYIDRNDDNCYYAEIDNKFSEWLAAVI